VSVLALIDANNFYCSCERAFDPRLRGKPLVVLSNNDGCVISRSNEAKKLGLKMAEPWHLVKDRPALRGVEWRSSNYALYGDLSRRVYQVLCGLVPGVEPYSIDEMFLDFGGIHKPGELALRVRHAVQRATKIPTCVGIGPTKTIAKLANAVAKMDRAGSGVCDLSNAGHRVTVYKKLSVDQVWGLGPASVKKLAQADIKTVAEFVALPDDRVRQLLTVVGLRTQWELRGIHCQTALPFVSARKSLAVTRSFGTGVESWTEMEQAVASYMTRAAEKLRGHGLVASAMQVFMHTNKFKPGEPSYANHATVQLEPTADTFQLVGCAIRTAQRLWRDGYRYAKAGVILLDLGPAVSAPAQLLPERDKGKSAALMKALDRVNVRHGRGALRPANLSSQPAWGMRRQKLSPEFTTCFEEMMRVSA
jgi:DNA polymerase V